MMRAVTLSTSESHPSVLPELTARQRAMLNFLYRYSRQYGYAPTIREIAQAMSISSTSVVSYHLKRLVRLGYLKRERATSRSLILCEAAYAVLQQPALSEAVREPRQLRLENQRLRAYSAHLEQEQARLRGQIAALEARLAQRTEQAKRRRWSVDWTP